MYTFDGLIFLWAFISRLINVTKQVEVDCFKCALFLLALFELHCHQSNKHAHVTTCLNYIMFLSGQCGSGSNRMFCQLPFLVLSIAAVFTRELMLDEVPLRHLFRVRLCSVENKEESFFSILSWNVRGREEKRPCFKCHLALGKFGKWTMVPGTMENGELDWNSPVMRFDKDWSIVSYAFLNHFFAHSKSWGN